MSQWLSMNTAPKDGTIIEIRSTYGVAPWYDIVKWTNEHYAFNPRTGKSEIYIGKYGWKSVKNDTSPMDGIDLMWRPYNGSVESYVDPTGGYQNDPKYWREMVAMKYGLPKDTFEKKIKKSFFQKIFGLKRRKK